VSYEEIKEGKVLLLVPEHDDGLGPKKTGEDVFYNPSMQMNRDTCISFLSSFIRDGARALDGMSATGVRGLRILKETSISNVTLNDVSHESVDLIKKNVESNSVSEQVKVTNDSIEKHLIENRYEYDYVDVDPFGTPVPYYPLAARYVSHNGVVGVTATDTSVLCGTYPRTCRRRYSVEPENNWCRHENGLRALIAYCVREAARHDRWVEPLLSYYEGHHFRTYLRIGEGAKKADKCLDKLKKITFHDYWWEQKDMSKDPISGPFWMGKLHSEAVLKDMDAVGSLSEKVLSLWRDEMSLPPFFYDTNEVSSSLETRPPPIKKIIRDLKEEGFRTSRTHFSPTGIKTEAPHETLRKMIIRL